METTGTISELPDTVADAAGTPNSEDEAPVADDMGRHRKRSYSQAQGMAELALGEFHAALVADDRAGKRRAFFLLATTGVPSGSSAPPSSGATRRSRKPHCTTSSPFTNQ